MSGNIAYRIRDWKQHFESYEQSRLKAKDGMRWVTITTKHDGKTFRRLSKMENGIAIYGAWVLIVAVAGKCPVRGVLADAEGPLTPEDLEHKTGFPEEAFAKAIELLSSERFMWIETVDLRESPQAPADDAGIPDDQRESPSTLPYPTPQDTTIKNPTPQEPDDGVSRKRFRLWRNATRQQILSPSGAQRVYELATGAGICTTSERHHVFRLILSLSEATGNMPAILTSILRGDAGKDSWKSRGGDFDSQAKEWMRSIDVPPEMQQRTSDLSTGPPSASIIDEHKRKLLEFEQKRKEVKT